MFKKVLSTQKVIVYLTVVCSIIFSLHILRSLKQENIGISKLRESFNVIMIGWDGVQREHLQQLLKEKKLYNLENFIENGKIIDLNITTGATETKPGWAEILTGYSHKITNVKTNSDYAPIPGGYTLFERLKAKFGNEGVKTIFLSGKINNLGARGPHKVCINCLTRDPSTREKTNWWDAGTTAPTKNQSEARIFEERAGEPYFNAKDSFDLYQVALGDASNVGRESIKALEEFKEQRFIALFHFEEPDEWGHLFNENSAEYSAGLMLADDWLGAIIDKLRELNIYDQTIIYVISDHGFDEGKYTHKDAPYTFMATNDKNIARSVGDRKDIAPTILQNYYIDISLINPQLEGRSLRQN